jgi:FKBP-type peptidyl-prolyl cis-trans isomerase FklB
MVTSHTVSSHVLKASGIFNSYLVLGVVLSSLTGCNNTEMQGKEDTATDKKLKANQAENASAAGKNGREFLAANKKKKGVVTLKSGLQYQVIKQGTGKTPKATDRVKTHYHGTSIDGTVFDSSVQRKMPATFPVNRVIKGWIEALQLMKVGSKWKLFIPSELAYGRRGSPPKIAPDSVLIFEIELLGIE